MTKRINTENAVSISDFCLERFRENLHSMNFDDFLFTALKFVFDRAAFKDPDLFSGFVGVFRSEFSRREEIHRAIDRVMDQYE